MDGLKREFRNVAAARVCVASVTRRSGFDVGPEGLFWGDRPVGYGGSLAIWPASMAKPAR